MAKRAVRRIPPPVLVPLVMLILFQLHLMDYACRSRRGDDFGKLYFGVRQGDIYAPTPATAWVDVAGRRVTYLNLNPPHVSLLVVPLAPLPFLPALRVWLAGQLACAVFICVLSARRG
jgi:hypothetical protein